MITLEIPSLDEFGCETTVTATLPHLTTVLPGGYIGYYQRGELDCFRAAVATMTQTPYDELDALEHPGRPFGAVSSQRHIAAFHEWAHERGQRGQRVLFHREMPPDEWAIGIAPAPIPEMSHTVVLRDGQVYFNPASGFRVRGGGEMSPISELSYIITLEPKGGR